MQRPAHREQTIVFDVIVAARKAGSELMLRVLRQLLVDLHLAAGGDRIRLAEMRLVFASCEGLRGQHLTAEVDDPPRRVGFAGAEERLTIDRGFKIKEGAPKAHTAREAVTRLVDDCYFRNHLVALNLPPSD